MRILAALIICVLVSGCTSKTEFGDCVGAFEDKDPAKTYKVDVGNVIVGIIFFELIAPPLYVIFDETHCPVALK